MNYLGSIGYVTSGNIKNVILDNINITGNSNVGGLAGRCDYKVSNVSANNITISANSYVGGVTGTATNQEEYTEQVNINLKNSNIRGTDYIGGITGQSYYIILTNCTVSETSITGVSSVGGMAGYKMVSPSYSCKNNIIDNCEISGSGSYIGGLNRIW